MKIDEEACKIADEVMQLFSKHKMGTVDVCCVMTLLLRHITTLDGRRTEKDDDEFWTTMRRTVDRLPRDLWHKRPIQ